MPGARGSWTVGRLARRFGLSRSTLLYYDSVGLLRPSDRSPAGYRLYTEKDLSRLEAICRYRKTGVGLKQIRTILDGPPGGAAAILEQRLTALNDEIGNLRNQQRLVVRLLRKRRKLNESRTLDKQAWVALLRATGLSDADMRRWHVEFESATPEAHRDFLESLGIPPDEVEQIRGWSRRESKGPRSRPATRRR